MPNPDPRPLTPDPSSLVPRPSSPVPRPAPLLLSVVSPSGTLFSGPVESVIIPAWDGLMGVLPGHAPLLALLRPGTVTARPASSTPTPDPQSLSFQVTGGFADVGPTLVRLIADSAALSDGGRGGQLSPPLAPIP
jgi:F-type H+-transporting ATPase subunit epsilon